MIKVGITGGIGSGKTTVCKIFEALGVPVYYSDIEAKRLMYQNKALKNNIKELLGNGAYFRNGRLNRAYVAQKIFNDKELLQKMNGLVHPAVHEDVKQWYQQQTQKYSIQEAALLVENHSYKKLDYLIVVTAPEELRIQRVMDRDNVSYESVKQRIKNQLPESEKVKVADFIINNDLQSSLIQQVYTIHRMITNKQ